MADHDDGHLSKDYLYDVRLLERHVAQGRVSRRQLDAHLAKLADLGDQAETVDLGRLAGRVAGRKKG